MCCAKKGDTGKKGRGGGNICKRGLESVPGPHKSAKKAGTLLDAGSK